MVGARHQPASARGRHGHVPLALGSRGHTRQSDPQPRTHAGAVHGRVCGEWQHPGSVLSLGQLGDQLERHLHLARVGLIRHRRPQHEVRSPGRLSRRRSEECHQRSQSSAAREQRCAEPDYRELPAIRRSSGHALRRVLRPGAMDARPNHVAGRPAVRSRLELFSAADNRSLELPAVLDRLSPHGRYYRLQGPHAARRPGVRRVRRGEDLSQGEHRQVSGAGQQRERELFDFQSDFPDSWWSGPAADYASVD